MAEILGYLHWEQTKCFIKHTYPVDEEGLGELDHLQGDQQADGDQVVVQDDERQQVVCKVGGDVACAVTPLVTYLSFAVLSPPLCAFLPARDRYQQASSVCSLFQMAAPTELTRAMTSRMPNRTRICMLVTRSTLERFSGALVEFWGGGRVSEWSPMVLNATLIGIFWLQC